MPPTETTWRIHDQIVAEWIAGNVEARFLGGENFLELVERSRRGLLGVTRGRASQRLRVAAHGGLLTALVRNVCLENSEEITPTRMDNCPLTRIGVTPRRHQNAHGPLP